MNLSDGGYLTDPTEEYGNILNPDVLPFRKISHHPCLILLGEPGMGKSFTLKKEYELARKGNDNTKLINLDAIGNTYDLDNELWKNSEFLKWESGSGDLTLFLDTFDECHQRIDHLPSHLYEKLKQLPVDRLKLRIACRTAHWPESLTGKLMSLYKEKMEDENGGIGIYEICPLRMNDVQEAAERHGINGRRFTREVKNANAVSFAIKPITLQFLIKGFKSNGGLPNQQSDLYLQGCKMLCDETNPVRRDSKGKKRLPVRQKLMVAGRIAAATILCNKMAVWKGKPEDSPETDTVIEDISGGGGAE